MKKERGFLQYFLNFLLSERKKINEQIKDMGDVSDQSEKYYVQKYKALLLKKAQLNYFISLIDNSNSVNTQELFISYKVLSDYIYSSPLNTEEMFETLVYFVNINAVSARNNESMPAAECLFDNYNILISRPIYEIRSYSKQINLLSAISSNDAFKNYYSEVCNKRGTIYKSCIINILDKISNGYENLDYYKTDAIIEFAHSLGINKYLIDEIELFIYKHICNVRNLGDNTLEFFEDYASWFKETSEKLNIFDKYQYMVKLCMSFLQAVDDSKYKDICELNSEMDYFVDIVLAEKGDSYRIPAEIKKFKKILK